MSHLSIRVMGEGERVSMLLDACGLPLFYPCLFATAQLRNGGAAVNTIRNKLADISMLLRWQAEQKPVRDLEAEFAKGHSARTCRAACNAYIGTPPRRIGHHSRPNDIPIA